MIDFQIYSLKNNSERKEVVKIESYQSNTKRFLLMYNKRFQTYGKNSNGNTNIRCVHIYLHIPIYTYIHILGGKTRRSQRFRLQMGDPENK